METALHTPFNSTLDAILHYFPIGTTTPPHERPESPFDHTPTPSPETTTLSTSTLSPSPLTLSLSLPPLALPPPYLYTGTPTPSMSPSHFSPSRQRQQTAPPSVPEQHPSVPISPNRPFSSTTANRMDISPSRQRLAAPPSARGGSGSSPSRSPRGFNALSPLQPMSMPKAAAAAAESPSQPPSLVRSMSRKQSMYDSAAKWEQGQFMREMEGSENTNNGSFSRLILVKAPEDVGLKQ